MGEPNRLRPSESMTARFCGIGREPTEDVAIGTTTMFGEETNGLLFSECKSYGRFEKKDYVRMRYLAKRFPRAVLVFCTLRKTLSPAELGTLARTANRSGPPN